MVDKDLAYYYSIGKFILVLILVLALGMLAINQGLGFFYKAEFLKSPCGLCSELNPGVKQCINNLNAPLPSYYNGQAGWTDPRNSSNQFYINISKP